MPEEFSVWMHDVADGAEVVVTGPVDPETAWSLWRTLEAACAMSPAVTVNLAQAGPVDATFLAGLLAMRDDLAASDRTLTLSGLRPADREPSHATASDPRAGRPGNASQRSRSSLPKPRVNPRGVVSNGRLPTTEDHHGWRPGQDTAREAQVVAQMSARLYERFPLLPKKVVEEAVRHRYRAYGTARIRDFVEVLVEREVGHDLSSRLA